VLHRNISRGHNESNQQGGTKRGRPFGRPRFNYRSTAGDGLLPREARGARYRDNRIARVARHPVTSYFVSRGE
jgi:hypothetical protein